jgi:hypothetical protein
LIDGALFDKLVRSKSPSLDFPFSHFCFPGRNCSDVTEKWSRLWWYTGSGTFFEIIFLLNLTTFISWWFLGISVSFHPSQGDLPVKRS